MRTQEIEQRVIQALDELGDPFEVINIDPEYADTAAFCERYGVPADHSGNTIICAAKSQPRQYCGCLVLATNRLDVNHAVRQLMGMARVSFASAEETATLTGMMIGGVTVFTLPGEVPIYIDEPVMALDYVVLGGGSRSVKIKISPQALRRLPTVTVVTGLSLPSV